MPEKMRAVVKTKAAPGAELVHIYEWDKWAQSRIHVPQTLGHEFAGEIVEVGSQVTKLKIGDYISAETHIPCNDCIQCLTGQQHICGNLKILGVDCNGCFAEYAAIPEIVAWKNDTSIPPEFATVQEPLGNAVYCTTVEPVLGKSVLIFGDGPTGLFAAGVARVAGAALIMIVGRHPVRLEIAKKMGADILINGHSDDVEAIVRTETGRSPSIRDSGWSGKEAGSLRLGSPRGPSNSISITESSSRA